MGLFDQMKNQVIGQTVASHVPGGDNPLVRAAVQLLLASGGVSGLQQRFQSRGMGDVADSWIGTGANRPIDESQVRNAFGDEEIDRAARDNGLSSSDLTRQLSGFLPNFVDRMTPEGRAPQQASSAESLLSAARGLFS